MKVSIVLFVFLLCGFHYQPGNLVKRVKLGKFNYLLYKRRTYSHDDNWNAEFFVFRRVGQVKDLCSFYIVAKRNDTVFIKGKYVLFSNRVKFMEYFYHNTLSCDFMKNIFYPNKKGDLIRKETIEFKNGKAITTINK